MKKKLLIAIVAVIAALFLFVQFWSWPLIGAEDEVAVYRVEHVAMQNGNGALVEIPLTGAQQEAVAEILRTQRCQGLTGDPFPLSTASYEWEVGFLVGSDQGWQGHYGGKNFVYQPASGPFNHYWHIANGETIAAALEALLL